MKRPLILSTLLCLVCIAAFALPHTKDLLIVDSRSGLSQNNVKSIAQDDYGFIWLGTKNGLCRYDGRGVRTMKVEDRETGKANQNISALEGEGGHLLWVGTDEGLFVYDTSADIFRHVDTQAADGQRLTNWVAEIWHDARGYVWVVPDEGIFRIETAKQHDASYI